MDCVWIDKKKLLRKYIDLIIKVVKENSEISPRGERRVRCIEVNEGCDVSRPMKNVVGEGWSEVLTFLRASQINHSQDNLVRNKREKSFIGALDFPLRSCNGVTKLLTSAFLQKMYSTTFAFWKIL